MASLLIDKRQWPHQNAQLAVLANGLRALPRQRLGPLLQLRPSQDQVLHRPLHHVGQAPTQRARPRAGNPRTSYVNGTTRATLSIGRGTRWVTTAEPFRAFGHDKITDRTAGALQARPADFSWSAQRAKDTDTQQKRKLAQEHREHTPAKPLPGGDGDGHG